MTKDELIAALQSSLSTMCDWAGEISDQYLDGEEGTRASFAADLERARELKAAKPTP